MSRVLVVGLIGSLLALVLPPVDGPAAVTLALLLVALAVIAWHARVGAVAAGTPATTYPPGRRTPPVLTGRVTDTVHHPLRPRAPGSV
jgi:hypothetical protein